MTTPATSFLSTPVLVLGDYQWERWVPSSSWPSKEGLLVDRPRLFDEVGPRAYPNVLQRHTMALYALTDLFWRLDQWLEAQGEGALVSWRMEAESTWTGLDEDYVLTPRQCLVIDLLPARGKMGPYPLMGEEAKEMASAIQGLTGHDLAHAIWEASTPLEERMQQMLGPSFLPIYRAQQLEKDLPQPSRLTSKPRF